MRTADQVQQTGMSTGAKVAIAVVVLAAIGGGGYLLLRKKDEAVPNCGYWGNCGE